MHSPSASFIHSLSAAVDQLVLSTAALAVNVESEHGLLLADQVRSPKLY